MTKKISASVKVRGMGFNRKRRKIFVSLLVSLLYMTVLISGISYVDCVREKNYVKSIEYVRNGNYVLASEGFEELHLINYKSFPNDVRNGKDFDKYYKDSAVLYAYTQAVKAFKSDNSENAAVWLEAMPEGYCGVLCDEITELKNRITADKNVMRLFKKKRKTD